MNECCQINENVISFEDREIYDGWCAEVCKKCYSFYVREELNLNEEQIKTIKKFCKKIIKELKENVK